MVASITPMQMAFIVRNSTWSSGICEHGHRSAIWSAIETNQRSTPNTTRSTQMKPASPPHHGQHLTALPVNNSKPRAFDH